MGGLRRREWVALGVGLTAAIAIRLILLPRPGLAGDVGDFLAWARAIGTDGLGHAYDQPISFPPVLPWAWWAMGLAATRSSSEPAPSSMTTTPAVACGTNTLRRPSPSAATNRAHSAVRSNSPRLGPVRTAISIDLTSASYEHAGPLARRRRALAPVRT